jgi:hypothetical protein
MFCAARTKRWWLFEAESIRWPRISFLDQVLELGFFEATSEGIFNSSGFADLIILRISYWTSSLWMMTQDNLLAAFGRVRFLDAEQPPSALILPKPRLPLKVDLHPGTGCGLDFKPVFSNVFFSASITARTCVVPGFQHVHDVDGLTSPSELLRKSRRTRGHASRVNGPNHWLYCFADQVFRHNRSILQASD